MVLPAAALPAPTLTEFAPLAEASNPVSTWNTAFTPSVMVSCPRMPKRDWLLLTRLTLTTEAPLLAALARTFSTSRRNDPYKVTLAVCAALIVGASAATATDHALHPHILSRSIFLTLSPLKSACAVPRAPRATLARSAGGHEQDRCQGSRGRISI